MTASAELVVMLPPGDATASGTAGCSTAPSDKGRSWLASNEQPIAGADDARAHAARNGVHGRDAVFMLITSPFRLAYLSSNNLLGTGYSSTSTVGEVAEHSVWPWPDSSSQSCKCLGWP